MPIALIDGIRTNYEVIGDGPPLLMYAPAGFDATLDKWKTQGVYARIRLLDHLAKKYTCIVFDRRETGQSGGRVERITWAHYVAQGKGLLDHLNIKRAHVLGGCMGVCPVAAFGASETTVGTTAFLVSRPHDSPVQLGLVRTRTAAVARLWRQAGAQQVAPGGLGPVRDCYSYDRRAPGKVGNFLELRRLESRQEPGDSQTHQPVVVICASGSRPTCSTAA